MAILVSTKVAREICDALNLPPNVVSLQLSFAVDSVATAEVTFRPNPDSIGKLPELLKRYRLTEVE